MHVKREPHGQRMEGTLTSGEARHRQQTLECSPVLGVRPLHAGDRESPTCQREARQLGLIQRPEISTTLQSWFKLFPVRDNRATLTSPTAPGPNYLPDLESGGCLRSACCLGQYRQTEGRRSQQPPCPLRGCIRLVVGSNCLPRAAEGVFPLGIFFFSSLPPASKGSSNTTWNSGLRQSPFVSAHRSSSGSYELHFSQLRRYLGVTGFITEQKKS